MMNGGSMCFFLFYVFVWYMFEEQHKITRCKQ